MTMRTPLSRVRGLGSAGEGTGHFWLQRVTGLANVILTVGFVWFVICALGASHGEFRAMVAHPVVAAMLILLIVSGVVHMRLGMQVIIEDYVHAEGLKLTGLVANTFFCAGVGLVGILSVLKLALGG